MRYEIWATFTGSTFSWLVEHQLTNSPSEGDALVQHGMKTQCLKRGPVSVPVSGVSGTWGALLTSTVLMPASMVPYLTPFVRIWWLGGLVWWGGGGQKAGGLGRPPCLDLPAPGSPPSLTWPGMCPGHYPPGSAGKGGRPIGQHWWRRYVTWWL